MATTVTPYNFRRPDRITKEQMHAVQMLHDRFARNISTSLSGYFRAMTEFRVTGVEQMSHSEFVTVLSDPTAFYALAIPPFDELGALEISPALAFTMIDRMLGGSGSEVEHGRPLTEIEQHIVDSIVRLMLEALNEIWPPVADMAFGIRGRETRPQMLQVAAHNDTVVLVTFEMTIGARAGAINLLLPASIVELTSAQFAQVWARPHREAAPIERVWLRENLARVPLPLSAVITTALSGHELLQLEVGTVLSLGRAIEDPLDVHIGQACKFHGRLSADRGWAVLGIESVAGDTPALEA